jgi:hypothetical protein
MRESDRPDTNHHGGSAPQGKWRPRDNQPGWQRTAREVAAERQPTRVAAHCKRTWRPTHDQTGWQRIATASGGRDTARFGPAEPKAAAQHVAGGRPGSECAARYERSNERGRGAAGSPDPALVRTLPVAGSPDPALVMKTNWLYLFYGCREAAALKPVAVELG